MNDEARFAHQCHFPRVNRMAHATSVTPVFVLLKKTGLHWGALEPQNKDERMDVIGYLDVPPGLEARAFETGICTIIQIVRILARCTARVCEMTAVPGVHSQNMARRSEVPAFC